MVADHVHQDLDSAGVGLLNEFASLLQGPEACIDLREVVRPVAVIAPEARLGKLVAVLLEERGHPQGRHSQILEIIELTGQSREISPVEGRRVGAGDLAVIARIAIGEAIEEGEIDDLVLPGGCSRLLRRARGSFAGTALDRSIHVPGWCQLSAAAQRLSRNERECKQGASLHREPSSQWTVNPRWLSQLYLKTCLILTRS